MKCKKCGADLKLSDEVCPYCGAVNYAAKRHIRDRKFYAQDYQSTHKQVSVIQIENRLPIWSEVSLAACWLYWW